MIVSTAVSGLLSYFAIRKVVGVVARIAALYACIFAPLMIYTIWFAMTPGDAEDFWVWWMTGLVMLSPVVAAWTVGTLSGGLLAIKAKSVSPWQ
ncbi:hypothetical protein [Allopontixanthobacter sp.]|uniref:hypothetical protein n=1 Tax=Allopontixanthobacter sp. TaxID=2906452 RepID=UPI002ABB6ED9|nr:hypothetical protein [Allopontixanthobacter sp.]MDZ4308329.1 hypothetical protein [Allopontixanthobacter sp.]